MSDQATKYMDEMAAAERKYQRTFKGSPCMRPRKPKGPTSAEWNAARGIGAPVRYRSVWGHPSFVDTKTRSLAWTMASGQHVVMVEAASGCVALRACEPLPALGSSVDEGRQ